MSELEDKINSVLSSPEEMSKIMQLAQSLMGDGGSESPLTTPGGESPRTMPASPETGVGFDLGGIDLSAIGKLLGGGKKNDKHALLAAMTPYLGEERRRKMSRAMQIAQLAGVAGKFLGSGEDNNV